MKVTPLLRLTVAGLIWKLLVCVETLPPVQVVVPALMVQLLSTLGLVPVTVSVADPARSPPPPSHW